jgi:ribosomal-protein-alanine N-acetyltransferase
MSATRQRPAPIESARLRLRPFTPLDFDAFFAGLVQDPEVMRFYHAYRTLTDPAQRRAKARHDFLGHFEAGWEQAGLVCWALYPKSRALAAPEDFIGWCGALTPNVTDPALGPEIAYMLARRFHGRGLATEALATVVADVFERHGAVRVHAIMDTPNVASRRVAERVGFVFRGQVEAYGSSEMVYYTLEREALTGPRWPRLSLRTARR